MNSIFDVEPWLFDRLQNFGLTETGAAIVDAVWFNGAYTSRATAIGMVLICNRFNVWKAYIGAIEVTTTEDIDAKIIAENGAKVPFAIAMAAFLNRFTEENYDVVV
jgi:hypothetical protein